MADKEIYQLDALTTATSDDILPIVDAPATTHLAKKITLANLMNSMGLIDGWVNANESWTYASATTITVPSNATTKYSVGDKIRLVQSSTTKYFYVIAVAATLLTVTGGSDYSVANAAITSNYYSKASSPVGFPQWFNYAITWTSAGAVNPAIGNGTLVGTFTMNGRTITAQMSVSAGTTTTYGDSFFIFSTPTSVIQGSTVGVWRGNDAGVTNYNGAVIMTASTAARLNINAGTYASPTSPWTMGNGDSYYFMITYGI